MNNTETVWVPASESLTPSQRMALAVPARAKPEQDLYNDLLAEKLQALVDQDPKEAKWSLLMSQEHAPEMWMIEGNYFPREWGQAIRRSDSAQSLLNQIDWAQPGQLIENPNLSLQEILEQLPA